MSTIKKSPPCHVCNGPTALGITPASRPMCIDNDCDKLAQEDVDALLVLPLSERLRSIDVMKGRRWADAAWDEDILGDLFDNDKTPPMGSATWPQPGYQQPVNKYPPPIQALCPHPDPYVDSMNGYTFCRTCGKRL